MIRQEIPAHILAKICWVGDRLSEQQTAQNDLSEFEVAFKKYLSDKSRNNIVNLGNSITDLLAALAHLNNIYKPGRLLDCDANDNDTLDGKIILGQSNLSKSKIMNTKLDHVTTQYRKFNDNQALTEGQLNEFIDYLKIRTGYQEPAERRGVVCGFQTKYIELEVGPASAEKSPDPEVRNLSFPMIRS
ncbi:hypothetical protein EJ377_17275 [Chryseobacterium arthrosphaerae]|uniref:Uncharacterized protein n=1 Tax=Chryseobacterium arthrosphaerae TaxID=651561 RepID=A0A3S0N1J2_9FLAO|nr:hypothetical protein EJ377_17275 [Chryseobacterium arthrosphaerae]